MEYGLTYTSLALNYLILHEVGHIVKGHTGYYYHLFNENVWNEFDYNSNKKSQLDYTIAQTLEMGRR